jgi:methylmalonyl-CoA mutase N-terminal domain/subunit
VANSIDPLGGSYLIEYLTNKTEKTVYEYFAKIDSLGGVIPAIEAGFFHREISDSAYRYQKEIENKKRIVVGVNEYATDEPVMIPLLEMDKEG